MNSLNAKIRKNGATPISTVGRSKAVTLATLPDSDRWFGDGISLFHGIILNGSPLFTGGASSGESEIRRWILENDWLEAIVALGTQIFYNTGIGTYVWLLNNRKPAAHKGKVIKNAVAFRQPIESLMVA